MRKPVKVVVIGGSAGSFQVISEILSQLKKPYPLPIVLCLHRLKHIKSGFVEALSIKSAVPIQEPLDKSSIKPGIAYLAPANYHMYMELGMFFSLSTEEMIMYSRPSIDITLESVGYVYREKTLGIILTGANKDGAWGLKKIKDYGGYTIVQDPAEAKVPTMPLAALELSQPDEVLRVNEIIAHLNSL